MKKGKRRPTAWNRRFGAAAKAAHKTCRRRFSPGSGQYKKCVGSEVKKNLG